MPLSQSTMIETFPARQSGMAMAIWGIGVMFAPIIGPTLGGWITDNWSWRWVFYINVPVGAAAVVMGWLFLPDSAEARPAVRRVDVPGLVLLVVGVSALQFVLDRGQREDWFASPLIVWLGIIAAVALVVLVVRELYAEEPVVDLRVLRHSTFAVATAAMFVISIAFYGIMVLSPLYTQILMGYTAMLAGMVLAPGGVATLITMPIAGVLMPRIDPRWVIATGCALNAYAMYLMATLTLEASYWHIMWPRFVQGLGIGFTFVPLSTMALGAVPAARAGPRLRALQLHPDRRRQRRHRRGGDDAGARLAGAPGAAGRPREPLRPRGVGPLPDAGRALHHARGRSEPPPSSRRGRISTRWCSARRSRSRSSTTSGASRGSSRRSSRSCCSSAAGRAPARARPRSSGPRPSWRLKVEAKGRGLRALVGRAEKR